MAITHTNTRTNEVTRTTYVGRVVELRTFTANRNMSDTLDYSDYRDVECKEAFVYVGRETHKYTWLHETNPDATDNPLQPVEVQNRFAWVDVSNHFAWRGEDVREATVDVTPETLTPEMSEDMEAYKMYWAAKHEEQLEQTRLRKIAEARATKRREMNKPVKGKKMVVCKGRKVKVGTVGTVAYIHNSGDVLLKADNEWQDRKAAGTWVSADNLMSRDCCPKDHDDCEEDEEMSRLCCAAHFKF